MMAKKNVEQVLGPPSEIEEPKIKPLFKIPMFDKQRFLSECVKIAADNNLRNENENLLKGKLEATELHLTDMRNMSKQLLDNRLKENIAVIETEPEP